MTETPQPAAPPPSAATTSPPPSPQQEKPPRLYRPQRGCDRGRIVSPSQSSSSLARWFSGRGNALTTAITTTACSAPSVPLPPVQGWDGCSGSPADPLPQAWAPVSLEARVARLLVRLVRVPPPRRRAP
ncbi:LOW QUALITY PROTEIN: conserved proline rich protein, partial [Mycobacterium tuberculosis T92]